MSLIERRASLLSFHSDRHYCLIFGVLLLFILGAAAGASATIVSTSGNVIYVDTSSNQSPKLVGNYVSYKITNNTGSPISDAWITVGNFTGAYVALAPNETGVAHLGTLAAGASRSVFFYLNVDCSSFSAGACNIGTAQGSTVKVYSGPPSTNLIESQSFSATVMDTIGAQANKVTTVVTSSNNPLLGTLLTVTVSGNTGTIGSAKAFYASPETYSDFPASSFRLYSTSITFSGGNTGTYTDQLLVPTSAFSSTSATDYSFVATYIVVGTTTTLTAVSPVAYISSGTQIKHTDTSGYASFPAIGTTSNSLTLQKLVNSQSWPTGGIPTYTLRISNSGNSSATLDDLIDTLPAGISFVPGSATFGGSAIGDPTISGNILTWTGIFSVPANGSADLTFQATVPNVPGTYTNSAVGHVGTTQIDTSIATSDNSPATVWLSVGSPDLVISKTHTGNFTQGQTGATYTITVGNNGTGATVGAVSVTDTLPSGLTATAISGTGWTCTLGTLTCSRSDLLATGGSYPAITLIVNVASNATASLTNTAKVSGGAEVNTANDSASDVTTITQLPDLTISKTHIGNFTQGQTGVTYTVTTSNNGTGPTSGTVTVTDTLPSGLTATAISGTGWTCTLGTLTCTRSDVLAATSSYPAITLTVNVANNAAATLTNIATVSGGGEANTANDSSSDATTITQLPDLTITKTHTGNFAQGQTGAAYTITVGNGGTGSASGVVTVTDTLPAGMTATAMGGTGWSCSLATLTCSRSDVLASGSSYPAITLTVNVASNASASLTNTATVSGGGEVMTANDTANDATTVTPPAQVATTTTLVVSPSSPVNAGTTVTLTATVLHGGTPVSPGEVSFCDATASQCLGAALLGTAQLNASGNASIKFVPGVGTISIKAVFAGASPYLSSQSSAQILTVLGTGGYITSTKISASGSAGNYTLTGTVTAFGKPVPTGTLSFLDTSNSNAVVASAALDSLSLGFTMAPASASQALSGAPSFGTAGDFNNDGKVDLAVPSGSGNSVSVLRGNGDGTFQVAQNYATDPNGQALAVAVGDVNGDGNPDLVVTNVGSSTVSVLLGNGDGTFQAQVAYVVGANPLAVVIGDFNEDGNLDIAVTDRDDNTVSVLLGNGDGTFQAQSTYAAGNSPVAMSFADLNADGSVDLVLANKNDNNVSVLLGNGDGTFQAPASYGVGSAPVGLVVGDFNNDGKIDIAASNSSDSTVSVLLGNGDGTFQSQSTFVIGNAPGTLVAADLNGDGFADLVSSNSSAGAVSILLGNGDGTFQSVLDFPVGTSPSGLAAGDFNGDGLADVAAIDSVSPSSANVLLSEHTISATATGVSVSGTGTHDVLASYPGDDSHQASQSTTVPLSGPAAATTTTTLSASPNPAVAGQAVTFTATVSPTPTGTPAGPVSFYNGTTLLGTVAVDALGVATFTTSNLPVGTNPISATYSGNTDFAASTSSTLTETITSAGATATTTTISASPNPASFGQAVTLTATVSPTPTGTPTGTVSFYDGATLLGTATVDNSGVATLTTSSLPVGTDLIAATYSGNAGFAGSTSSTLSETITKISTTTGVTASPNPATAGQTVALTATISPTPTGTPTGTVSFYNGTTLLGTATVNASGVATLGVSDLTAGTANITAVYSGNTNYATSTSTVLALTVSNAATYNVTAPQTPYSVKTGGATSVNVSVPPIGGSYDNVVTMSASGLPPGAVATFNPPTVTPGSSGANTVMTIQTAAQVAAVPRSHRPEMPFVPMGFAAGICIMASNRKRLAGSLAVLLILATLMCGALIMTGCGGGFRGTPVAQPHTYVITITGTSGSLHPATTITLVVQ